MKNDQTPKSECPVCATPAQAAKTFETCLRLPGNEQVDLDAMLDRCIKPGAFHAFRLHDEGADPCIDCKHNEVIHDPGTFVGMQQTGEKRWAEIHECPSCHTRYEILTS